MYLKSLNISGFKSFGSKNFLEFPLVNEKEKGITAVVGPNGSGKSNIADAIRWVLGEQSAKVLRIKKNEDIIFFGSAKKGKGAYSEVTMVLDNTSNKAELDFSEIEITRRIYRNGENEYLLNKKRVRLADIQELLAKCGFGRATYTVIGQGMIDNILFYGPAERKVLFEEASGVKQYEIKREQALKKLEATDRNVIRIKDILFELEPRLKTAQRQYKKYKNKQELEDKLKVLSTEFYSNEMARNFAKKEALESSQKELSDKEAKIQKEIDFLNQEIQKGFNKKSADREEIEKLKRQIESLDSEKNEIIRSIYSLEADLKTLGASNLEGLKIREEDLKKTKGEIAATESEMVKDQKEKDRLTKEMLDKKEDLEKIDLKINKITEEIQNFQKKAVVFGKDDATKELNKISSEYQSFLESLSGAQSLKEMVSFKQQAELILQKIKSLIDKMQEKESKEVFRDIEKSQTEGQKLVHEKDIKIKEIHELRVAMAALEEALKMRESRKNYLQERATVLLAKISESSDKETAKKTQEIMSRIEALKSKRAGIENATKKLSGDLLTLEGKSNHGENFYAELYEEQREKEKERSLLDSKINEINIEIARVTTKSEDLKSEIIEHLGFPFYENLKNKKLSAGHDYDFEGMQTKIQRLRKESYALGDIDPFINEEYDELNERVGYLSTQMNDMENAKEDLEKIIADLDVRIKKQFKETFAQIAESFSRYFKILFNGGSASLTLEASEDKQFSVEINATPPGKKNQNLASLSGGERTMTAIALLFAIITVNPSPFCVLDEVDASLDESNTEKFLSILKTLTSRSQFLMITHNQESMKKAHYIYGVSMDENHLSQTYSLRLT